MTKQGVVRTALVFGCLAFGGVASSKEVKDSSKTKTTTQEFMDSKRIHMHELFDAVIFKSFERAIEKSKILLMLSQASTWHQIDSDDYKNLTKKFQEEVKATIVQAELKSSQGLTKAYTNVAVACMSCHQELRWGKK